MTSDEMLIQERRRYNLWELLGDVGGFHDGLVLLINLFLAPYAAGMFKQSLVNGDHFTKKKESEDNQRKRVGLIKHL